MVSHNFHTLPKLVHINKLLNGSCYINLMILLQASQKLWLDLHKERKGNLRGKTLMIKTSNKPNLDQMLESYIGLCDLEVLC